MPYLVAPLVTYPGNKPLWRVLGQTAAGRWVFVAGVPARTAKGAVRTARLMFPWMRDVPMAAHRTRTGPSPN